MNPKPFFPPHLLWLFLAILPSAAWAHDLVVPGHLIPLKRGFEYVYNEEYEKAETVFLDYVKRFPDRPEGYFFMAGRFAEQINARHDRGTIDELNKWADLVVAKSEEFNRNHPGDPAGYFYLGNIYGYLGLVEAQEQHLVQAFMLSIKAKKNLETALTLSPNLYDCYFGLGTLFYYASRKHAEEDGLVGWIVKTFITNGKDLRAEGILMLKKAWTNGGITSDVAFSSYMWVLIAEGRGDEALPLAEEMIRRWPNDRHGYWAAGRIHLIRGDCRKAQPYFEQIRHLVEDKHIAPARFPEIALAAEVTQLCIDYEKGDGAKIAQRLKHLREKLKRFPNVQIEYANSKGAVHDWISMANEMERKTFLELPAVRRP